MGSLKIANLNANIKVNDLFKVPNIFPGSNEARLFSQIAKLAKGGQLPTESVQGQFSVIQSDGTSLFLIRDRLGINKLFYHIDRAKRTLTVGNFIRDVAQATGDYNNILSVPPGHYLRLNEQSLESELVAYYDISRVQALSEAQFDLTKFQKETAQTLESYFVALNERFPKSLFIVCLSGGLDSSAIASFAKRYLSKVKAVTFSFGTDENQGVSEDFQAGSQIANSLGLEFVPIVVPRQFDLPTLDRVLENCQDWRDFNVHCAWLNNIMGEQVRKKFPTEDLVFLTGDLMNEFVADYTAVTYKDVEYYSQPKVPKNRLRRFFIYGLDTSDREVGIFHQYGIKTVQPYAALAEMYLMVPDQVIERPGSKELLNLSLIPSREVADLIVKKKVRAQVGGKDGGTLALFHENKANQEFLKERWDKLFLPLSREREIRQLIYAGRYRSS